MQPTSPTTATRIGLAGLAGLLWFALVASACGESGESNDVADIEAIETHDGGILVKPPDVLSGETEVIDGQDTSPQIPTVEEATSPAGDGPAGTALPPAPAAEFTWFDGTPGSISELQGAPTVLNFWASTCAACVAEMPEFDEVAQALEGTVAFVGMNTGDRRDAADRLAEQTGVTYPLAEDPGSEVFRAFRGFVMPTTVFLTADGQVAYTWSGVLTADELRRLIDRHLAPGTYEDV